MELPTLARVSLRDDGAILLIEFHKAYPILIDACTSATGSAVKMTPTVASKAGDHGDKTMVCGSALAAGEWQVDGGEHEFATHIP